MSAHITNDPENQLVSDPARPWRKVPASSLNQPIVDPLVWNRQAVWNSLKEGAFQLAAAPGRLMNLTAQAPWSMVETAMSGEQPTEPYQDPTKPWRTVVPSQPMVDTQQVKDFVGNQLVKLKADYDEYLQGDPDVARQYDAALRGIVLGGVLGRGVYGLQAHAAPWIKNLNNMVSAAGATTMTAGSAGAGELAIELTMAKVVEPVLDQTEMDPATRMAASAGLYLFLGFTSALTLERQLDKLMGNKIFLDWVQEAGAKAKNALTKWGGKDAGLTEQEIVQYAIYNDPELLRRLYKEIGEPDDGIENILKAGQELVEYSPVSKLGSVALANAKKQREALVKAGRDTTGIDKYIARKEAELEGGRPTSSQALVREKIEATSFKIVKQSGPTTVSGMRAGVGGSHHMNNTAPGASGWLGNPYKWEGNGGAKGVTLQDAIDSFEKDFLRKVESDPAFREHVLNLHGKHVSYYKPENNNHLRIVQEWIATERMRGVKPAEPKAKPAEADVPILGKKVFELKDPSGEGRMMELDLAKVKQAMQEKLSIFDKTPTGRVVSDAALNERYPNAARFLHNRVGQEPSRTPAAENTLNTTKQLREKLIAEGKDTTGVDKRIGQLTEPRYNEVDLHKGLHYAYNRFQPGTSWKAADVDEHVKVLVELEELNSLFRAGRAEEFKTPWEWQKGLEGKIEPKQLNALTDIVQRLSRNPDFSVEWTKDQNAYAALAKIMRISDAKFFGHELGHWTWHQVLKPADRIGFVERLWKNYQTAEDWNGLDPTRRFFQNMQGKRWINPRTGVKEVIDEKVNLDKPTELFANLVQDYVLTYRVPEAGFKAIIGKATKTFKQLAQAWRTHENIPPELRQFVQKVMRAPDPRDSRPLHLRETEDLVARSYMFRPREELLKIIEGIDSTSPEQLQTDVWLQSIMLDGMSAFDALAKSQANVENIIERLHRDVLTWYHLDTGNPVELDLAVRRMNELFMPANKSNMEKRIGAQYGKFTEGGSDEIDISTGSLKKDVMDQDSIQRERVGAAKRASEHKSATDQSITRQYQALKQMANDLGVMHQWMNKVKDGTDKHWIFDSRNQQALRIWREAVDQDMMTRSERVADDFATVDAVKDPETGDIGLGRNSAVFHDDLPFDGSSPSNVRLVQLRLMPQAISAMMGLDTDSEHGIPIPGTNTRLTWNPEKWLTYGYGIGPALSAYSLFGRGLRHRTNRRLDKFWGKLENMDPATAEYISNKWKGVSKHWLVRAFREREGLTGDLATIDRSRMVDETKIQREFNEFANRINEQFTKDEQRVIAELIERTGDVGTAGWRQEVYDKADEIQAMLRGIRHELVDAGYPKEILEKYGDRYLHRIFKKKTRERMSQDFETKLARKMYESLEAGFLKPRGHAESLRSGQKEFTDFWQLTAREGVEIKPGDRVYDFGLGDNRQFVPDKAQKELKRLEVDEGLEWNHVWEVEKAGGDKLVLRRDHTKMERDAFGEIKEIAPRVAEYGKLVAKALAQARAFNKISGLKELVFDPKVLDNLTPEPGRTVEETSHGMLGNLRARGWVQVPDTELEKGLKRFGSLAGKYVEPEVMYALRAATSTLPDNPRIRNAFRKFRSAMTVWKVAKTAYNPGTHGRNFTANTVMCVLDGRNPASVLLKGGWHVARKDELFTRAINAGMLDSNVLRGELGLDTFLTALERAEAGPHPLAGADNAVTAWMNGFAAATKRGALWAGKAPMRIYELGDEVFKMGIFAQEIARGADDATAMAKAQELFFDYRDVPIGVKYLRDYGIVPFVTYTYKVMPVLAKTMKENPHRMLGVIAAAELYSDIMLQSEFGDDFQDVKTWQQKLFPDWMGKRPFAVGPKGSVYLGERKSDQGMDYSLWYDYIANLPGGDALTGHGLLGGFPFGMNPMVSIAYGMITNRDPNFEKAIAADEPLTTIQKVDNFNARMKFILRTLLPNVPMYPGSFSLEKLGQAATAQGIIDPDVADRMGWTGRDYWGTEESLNTEAVNFFGMGRIRKFYPEMETVRRIDKHDHAISKFEQTLDNMIDDQRTSPAELDRAVKKFETVVEGNAQAMERISDLYTKAQKVLVQRRKKLKASQQDPERDR